jgi:predicted dehydrogenase
VNVSVPDHMHAMITLAALESGKHVYCQKPLCHDVAECRAVAQAAKKNGRISQLGTQAASGFGDQMAVKHLRNGVLGHVKKVITCSNRPGAIAAYRALGPRPNRTDAVPESLDWNLWLATAPERPFVNGIYHPSKWRGWQDFGTSWLGDIACHVSDFWWRGLQLKAPKSVIAKVQQSWLDSPERRADTWPQSQHITWMFDGNKASGGKDFTVEWFDGLMFPSEEYQVLAKAAGYKSFPAEGAMVIGEEGAMIVPNASGPTFSPRDKFKGIARPKPVKRNHYHHFVDDCLGGEKTESFFEQTWPMTDSILLGTVAARIPNTKLEWDAEKMEITNVPEARKYLSRTYRKGW